MWHLSQRKWARCAVGCGLLLSFIAVCAGANSSDKGQTVELPSEPVNWINSSPLTLVALEGKGAVVYFFEETCPRCRARWPELMALSKKYEDQPVAFVAVNSGTDRAALQAYAQQNKVGWPILVDYSRELEKLAGVGEISLQNIYQVRVITPNGKMAPARWDDLEGAVQMALPGAHWKIDPADIPASVKPAWHAIEFGNYATAGKALAPVLKTSDATTKQAVDKLVSAVKPKIAAAVADAKTTFEAGDKWTALAKYSEIPQLFAGFELPTEVAAQRAVLQADPQVKAIKQAAKDLEGVQRMFSATANPAPALRNKAVVTLKRVAKDAAGTEYAKQAEDLLAKINPAGN
jgi:thiol-disulfide isomerase/thioredoxin